MRFDFMAAISESKPSDYGKLNPAHLMQIRETANSIDEAERKIRARYTREKRFKLEDLQFLGVVE